MTDVMVSKRGKSSKTSRYEQIATVLREEIKTNYSPRDSIPSQLDLAKRFKVSYMTVNNAMKQLVEEGLVTRTVGQGTFVCDQKKKKKTSKGLVSILLSYDYHRHAGVSDMFCEIGRELEKSLFRPVLFGGHVDREEEKQVIEDIGQFQEAGVIIYSPFTACFDKQIKKLINSGISVVTIHNAVEGCDCSGVDQCQVAKLQAEYLVEQNCQHILYIGMQTKGDNDLKLPCFFSTLAERDYSTNSVRVSFLNVAAGELGQQKAEAQVGEIIRNNFSENFIPDGLVIHSDAYLKAAVDELNLLGVVPGKDVKIVSTDNQNISGIPYASIDEGWGQIGHNAAKMLLDRLEGRYSGQRRVNAISPQLVVHE